LTHILYLDTSALAKLYLDEPGRQKVLEALKWADEVAICAIDYTEMCSLLSRREREGSLNTLEFETVLEALEQDWNHMWIIELGEDLTHRAGRLTRSHALRALDALHLAAALELRSLGTLEFLTFDVKLLEGARVALETGN